MRDVLVTCVELNNSVKGEHIRNAMNVSHVRLVACCGVARLEFVCGLECAQRRVTLVWVGVGVLFGNEFVLCRSLVHGRRCWCLCLCLCYFHVVQAGDRDRH